MYLLQKLKLLLRNIKIREKMILIYFFGGILPMLVVILYNNHATKDILIKQSMESEVAELSLIKDGIYEKIRMVSDVSKNMYFDPMIEKIAFTQYESYQELLNDYYSYTKISDSLSDYYQDIASIKIYLDNETISNNSNFMLATEEIKSQEWYQGTLNQRGNVYWSYINDVISKKKCLRLSRVLYTEDMEQVGVLSIVLQNKRTELPISNRKNKTALVYNNEEIVHANFDKENYFEILDIVQDYDEDVYYGKVIYEQQDCFMVMVKVKPDFSENYFTLVSVEPYSEIVEGVNKTSLTECLPFLLCIVLTCFLISVFSNHFSRQINQFRETMHEAATGTYKDIHHLDGRDELSMLYEDLNIMIQDMQGLMEKVVTEQVQKEQLNSRQREVEFKMLASQINPHFLYNTLETIRMQAIVNKQSDIADLAKMLAKIMRRNIQVSERLVSLESELKLVEYYLKIQYYRFSDRIQSEIIVEDNVDQECLIMPLIIQPLVENAFVHGLESRETDGLLTIHVSVDECLIIRVKDNGAGITEERLEEVETSLNDYENLDRTHIGVCNVNQRIKLQYGENYGLSINSKKDDGTLVIIRIPVVKNENYNEK